MSFPPHDQRQVQFPKNGSWKRYNNASKPEGLTCKSQQQKIVLHYVPEKNIYFQSFYMWGNYVSL